MVILMLTRYTGLRGIKQYYSGEKILLRWINLFLLRLTAKIRFGDPPHFLFYIFRRMFLSGLPIFCGDGSRSDAFGAKTHGLRSARRLSVNTATNMTL